MLETIKKIPDSMILDSVCVLNKKKRKDYYYLINMPDTLPFEETRENLYFKRFALLQMIVSYGIQPITGYVSYDGEYRHSTMDIYENFIHILRSIEKMISNTFVKAHGGLRLKEHSKSFFDKNVIKAFVGTTTSISNDDMIVGCVNQKYITNSKYVSLNNILVFGESEFWNRLSPIDVEDVKIINELVQVHYSPLFKMVEDEKDVLEKQKRLNDFYNTNNGIKTSFKFVERYSTEKNRLLIG